MPRIERDRYTSGGNGYRHDNADVCFENPGRRKKDILPVDGPFADGQAGIAGAANKV